MINVLIVEDEPPILRRIREMVERLDPMFSVAATALNGKEALLKLNGTHIDLVITDIQMPVLDGLALMDEIQERYPECMIVVLSGYQDYEYMSHAIRARSLDYLLKPISAEAMAEMLSRVKAQHLSRGRERLSRRLASSLNKAAPEEERPHSDDEAVGVCLFCAGCMPMDGDAEMYPGAGAWPGHSLEQLAEQIVPGFASFCWEFMGDTCVERILVFQAETGEFEPWIKRLHEMLQAGAKLPVSCACMAGVVRLNGVGEAIKRLRGVLRERIRIGRGLFVCLDGDRPETTDAAPDDRETILKLTELLAGNRIGGANPFRRELFQRMEREEWTQARVAAVLTGAAAEMERDARTGMREQARQYKRVLSDAVCAALSFAELEQNVCSLAPANDSDAQSGSPRQAEVADSIERYLREYFAQHITNQTLAQEFGYVPSYISLLFRQKHQLSPSEYLTQVRIEEAKKLMQAYPDMLIREVAERVGFKNQHHFSRIFTKRQGMWPKSYHA